MHLGVSKRYSEFPLETMNLFPLRVILIASILLVAKVATVKAQSDGHDLYDIDSYEPMPSFFDTFPGSLMLLRRKAQTLNFFSQTVSLYLRRTK